MRAYLHTCTVLRISAEMRQNRSIIKLHWLHAFDSCETIILASTCRLPVPVYLRRSARVHAHTSCRLPCTRTLGHTHTAVWNSQWDNSELEIFWSGVLVTQAGGNFGLTEPDVSLQLNDSTVLYKPSIIQYKPCIRGLMIAAIRRSIRELEAATAISCSSSWLCSFNSEARRTARSNSNSSSSLSSPSSVSDRRWFLFQRIGRTQRLKSSRDSSRPWNVKIPSHSRFDSMADSRSLEALSRRRFDRRNSRHFSFTRRFAWRSDCSRLRVALSAFDLRRLDFEMGRGGNYANVDVSYITRL